ncbi:MAG: hypothetical protein QM504_10275 [Pseudomonadota bacterium]
MANIDINLKPNLLLEGWECKFIADGYQDVSSPVYFDGATDIVVFKFDNGLTLESFALPKKKLVDLAWIMSKLNTNVLFSSFTKSFRSILSSAGIGQSLTLYPTSYGFGFSVLFRHRNNASEYIEKLCSFLDESDIKYKTEYSDARWVFRIVISKSKVNMQQLKRVLQEC